MEAISVAASITALLTVTAKISSALQNFISSAGDAHNIARAVNDEIHNISCILGQLEPLFHGNPFPSARKATIDIAHYSSKTLSDAEATVRELQERVGSFARANKMGIFDRARLARQETDISRLFERLQHHKSSLALILMLLTRESSIEARNATDTACRLLINSLNQIRAIESKLGIPEDGSTSDGDPILTNTDATEGTNATIGLNTIAGSDTTVRLDTIARPDTTARPDTIAMPDMTGGPNSTGNSDQRTTVTASTESPTLRERLHVGSYLRTFLSTSRSITPTMSSKAGAIGWLGLPGLSLPGFSNNFALYASVRYNAQWPDVSRANDDSFIWQVLYQAAANGEELLVRLLLIIGADVAAETSNGMTALHNAALHGHEAVVRLLLEKGADVDKKTHSGRTPLHLAALGGYKAVLLALLEMEANIAATTTSGSTALHYAAGAGNKAVVRLLLDNRADFSAKTRSGMTAMHWAGQNQHMTIVWLLLGQEKV